MSKTYASLIGLDKALEIQGGMKGPEDVRDEAGIYLYHDIGDYLSRAQTYQIDTPVTVAVPGAAGYTGFAPSNVGIPFGRYLVGCGVVAGGSPVATITGWAVFLQNSGIQPGYPITTAPAPFIYGVGTNTREYAGGGWILVPDNDPPLPLWCPPGSYLFLYVKSNAAGPNIILRATWHSTEALDQAGTTPVGIPRAPVKV